MATNIKTETEFDYLLALDEARTPGKISANGEALQFGNYHVDGFKQSWDAQYLARSAASVPRLIKQLLLARQAIARYLRDIALLRRENVRLKSRLHSLQMDIRMIDESVWLDVDKGIKYQAVSVFGEVDSRADLL